MTKASREATDDVGFYVGLDMSKDATQVCVVGRDGRIRWQGKVPTDPDALARSIRRRAPGASLVGLEMGAMAGWLWRGMRSHGLPVYCIDARHAHAALSVRMNKTDRHGAQGIAELMRTGWYRPVEPRSEASQGLRMLLSARARLVRMRADAQNQVRGMLKERGIRLPRAVGAMFRRRVRDGRRAHLEPDDPLVTLVEGFMRVHEQLADEQRAIDDRVEDAAAADGAVGRLMTIAGVGVVTAVCFRHTVDAPERFTSSSTVGAYLGLTPRRHRSGERGWTGRISKRGSSAMRAVLCEAANAIMHRLRRSCALKRWATTLAARIGVRRAKVALARKLSVKLSVVMHTIWMRGTTFDWGDEPNGALAS